MNLMESSALSSVFKEYFPGSKYLYLIFSGRMGGVGITPFEFSSTLRILKENKIFFRDLHQIYYHTGLVDISQSIPETVRYIRSEIEHLNLPEVIFIGNSMGGFAAILFSLLLQRGYVFAFSPVTYVSRLKRLITFDRRNRKGMLNIYRKTRDKPRYFDLKPLAKRNCHSRIKIFYSSQKRIDVLHAKNLKSCPHVQLIEFREGGHTLVKHLRDTNLLRKIIYEFIEPD